MEVEGDVGEVGRIEPKNVVGVGIRDDLLLARLLHQTDAVHVLVLRYLTLEMLLER